MSKRSAGMRVRIVAAILACLPGCAPPRAPLPVVPAAQLPDRWVAAMAAEPCPHPIWARLRIRVEVPGQPGVTLEGLLQTIPPDSMRLTARLGAFRPVFILLANADSCELLLHGTSRYWVAPRTAPDWANLNPSAWAEALGWMLCPGDLFRRFRPEGPGRIQAGRWVVSGGIEAIPWDAEITLEMKSRSLLGLDLTGAQRGVVARIRSTRHSRTGEAWLPELLEISRPSDGLLLRIERVSSGRLDRRKMPGVEVLGPPGWTRGASDLMDLQLPVRE